MEQARDIESQNRDEIDVAYILRRILDRRLVVGISTVFGLMAGLLYLHIATPKYQTTVRVTPASSTSSGLSNRLGSLGNIAAAAGVSFGSTSDAASPFDLYIDTLLSRSLADELSRDNMVMRSIFPSQWDARTNSWVEPHTIVSKISKGIKGLIGFPPRKWAPPNGEDLQTFLNEAVTIKAPGPRDAPITVISMQYKDRSFSEHLMKKMTSIAEERIRQEALVRAEKNVAFLSLKLGTAVATEHRRVLADALAEQERVVMMTSSKTAPYAAIVVEAPSSSKRPASPNYVAVALAAPLSGLIIGILLALLDFSSLSRLKDEDAEKPQPINE